MVTARKHSSNTAEIQAKLDHSAAAVRKLVSSWLPEESDESGKVGDDEDDESLLVSRPPRLGLGASSIEKNTNTPIDATAKLKRKLLGRRLPLQTQSARQVLTQPTPTQKDESSDDEEGSRGSVGKKRKAVPAPVGEKLQADAFGSESEEKEGGSRKGGFSFDSYKQEKSKKAKKRKRNKQAAAAANGGQ
ncbi:hypothetical protein YB2330_005905 [Saitoella coloradoensis]